MMESQGILERTSEQRLAGTQAAHEPTRARRAQKPTSADVGAGVGEAPRGAPELLPVQASLVLLVLGALSVLLSVRMHSDPALLLGYASLLASGVLYKYTRARLIARLERHALARGLAPADARRQSAEQADQLLAQVARDEPRPSAGRAHCAAWTRDLDRLREP